MRISKSGHLQHPHDTIQVRKQYPLHMREGEANALVALLQRGEVVEDVGEGDGVLGAGELERGRHLVEAAAALAQRGGRVVAPVLAQHHRHHQRRVQRVPTKHLREKGGVSKCGPSTALEHGSRVSNTTGLYIYLVYG
jgi:hypothetical protein